MMPFSFQNQECSRVLLLHTHTHTHHPPFSLSCLKPYHDFPLHKNEIKTPYHGLQRCLVCPLPTSSASSNMTCPLSCAPAIPVWDSCSPSTSSPLYTLFPLSGVLCPSLSALSSPFNSSFSLVTQLKCSQGRKLPRCPRTTLPNRTFSNGENVLDRSCSIG